MSTSSRLAYWSSSSAVSNASIHAFWLAASGDADRMANVPPSSPRISSAMSAMTTPVSSKSTWATNRLSPSPDGIGESQLTTFTSASVAASTPDWICSPALFEIITASTPWVAALVMVSICPVGSSQVDGPRNSGSSAPSSSAASCAPSLAWSNTAMPVHLGSRMEDMSSPASIVTASPEALSSELASSDVAASRRRHRSPRP